MLSEKLLVDEYLKKLGGYSNISPNLKSLTKILNYHVEEFCFSTIITFMENNVSIEASELHKKLITKKNGGFCIEQNSLLSFVLRNLGYNVKTVLSRAYLGELHEGIPPKIHLINIVTIDNKQYLIDPGFGGVTPNIPVCINDIGVEQKATLESFRIVSGEDSNNSTILGGSTIMLQVLVKDEWLDMYSFTPEQEAFDTDIDVAKYHITHSKLPVYLETFLLSRMQDNERFVLYGLDFKHYKQNSVTTIEISNYEDFKNILIKYFNITDIDYKKVYEKVYSMWSCKKL